MGRVTLAMLYNRRRWRKAQVGSQMRSQVGSQMGSQVGSPVGSQVGVISVDTAFHAYSIMHVTLHVIQQSGPDNITSHVTLYTVAEP